MRIASRVRQLERSRGVGGPCSTCGGAGTVDVIYDFEREPQRDREPRGCPECGKVILIVLRERETSPIHHRSSDSTRWD